MQAEIKVNNSAFFHAELVAPVRTHHEQNGMSTDQVSYLSSSEKFFPSTFYLLNPLVTKGPRLYLFGLFVFYSQFCSGKHDAK